MKTINKIVIPVHSVVDLITNSSSELYTSASEKTVKALTEFADQLLAISGSPLRSTDIFDIKLVVTDSPCYGDEGDEFKNQYASTEKEAKTIITTEQRRRNKTNGDSSDAWPRISSELHIEPKPGYADNESVKKITKVLSKLGDTFYTEDVSNY
jgi:hypothetical protein